MQAAAGDLDDDAGSVDDAAMPPSTTEHPAREARHGATGPVLRGVAWAVVAAVHAWLGAHHTLALLHAPSFEHAWKGPGALLGAVLMLALAVRAWRSRPLPARLDRRGRRRRRRQRHHVRGECA
jgi:hypothetical protein